MTRVDRIYPFTVILVFLAVCYSVQVFTPLRLHPDAVVLLSVAESAAQHGDFLYHGQPTVFPPGYPAFLASLLKMGIAHSWLIVAVNVGLLFLGLFAVRYILMLSFFRDQVHALSVCVLSLFSFAFIRFVAIPLSDVPFFALAMCLLAAMEYLSRLTPGPSPYLRIVGVGVGVIGAIAVRRIGVALIPPFLWMILCHPATRMYVKRLSSRLGKPAIASTAFVGALLIAWVVVNTNTSILQAFRDALAGQSLLYTALAILGFRLKELGELTVNVPFLALPELAWRVLPWVGALSLVGALSGLVLKRKTFGPTEVFVIGYIAILTAWPYYDPRFWLPLIPLLISYCALTIERVLAGHHHVWSNLFRVYLTVYAVMGAEWLISSTMITFSRSAFVAMYIPEKEYGPAYCVAFGSCRNDVDPRDADQNLVHLLRLYK